MRWSSVLAGVFGTGLLLVAQPALSLDIETVSVTVTPATVQAGQRVTIVARVRRIETTGAAKLPDSPKLPAVTVNISFFREGESRPFAVHPMRIGPNGTVQATAQWMATPGRHRFSARADLAPGQPAIERNLANNARAAGVEVVVTPITAPGQAATPSPPMRLPLPGAPQIIPLPRQQPGGPPAQQQGGAQQPGSQQQGSRQPPSQQQQQAQPQQQGSRQPPSQQQQQAQPQQQGSRQPPSQQQQQAQPQPGDKPPSGSAAGASGTPPPTGSSSSATAARPVTITTAAIRVLGGPLPDTGPAPFKPVVITTLPVRITGGPLSAPPTPFTPVTITTPPISVRGH
jgi:hypothetical protein